MNDETLISNFIASQTSLLLTKQYQEKQNEIVKQFVDAGRELAEGALTRMFGELRIVLSTNKLPDNWSIDNASDGVIGFKTTCKRKYGRAILSIESCGGTLAVIVDHPPLDPDDVDDGTKKAILPAMLDLEEEVGKKFGVKHVAFIIPELEVRPEDFFKSHLKSYLSHQ